MELAVGRKPHPIAGAAVRLADRADEAGHPARARDAVVTRLVGGVFRGQLGERAERGFDAPPRLDVRNVSGDRQPRAFAAAQRHQLDEAHMPVALEGQPREVHHIGLVVARSDDGVELDRREAGRLRRHDARPDFIEAAPSHLALYGLGIKAVEVHIDATQARLLERRGQLREQQRIGGEREAADTGHARHPLDDFHDIGAQQRLASGQAELVKADADRGARDHLVFGGLNQLGIRQEAQPLQRHAVDASEVAAVRDRHPQVIDFAIEGIFRHCFILGGARMSIQPRPYPARPYPGDKRNDCNRRRIQAYSDIGSEGSTLITIAGKRHGFGMRYGILASAVAIICAWCASAALAAPTNRKRSDEIVKEAETTVMAAGKKNPVDTAMINEAIADLHQALKIEPRNDSAYVDLGFCYSVLRDAETAQDMYRTATLINPS